MNGFLFEDGNWQGPVSVGYGLTFSGRKFSYSRADWCASSCGAQTFENGSFGFVPFELIWVSRRGDWTSWNCVRGKKL
jgi:hypothetical protein